MKGKIVITTILSMSCLFLVGCQNKDNKSITNKEQVKNIKTLNNDDKDNLELELYFDSSKNEDKAEIGKTELLLNRKEVIGSLVINNLIKGPAIKSDLKPVLPKETKLLSFSIKDDVAIINLSKEAKVTMTKAKEEACLKSIASSVLQLEGINKINILIDNQMVDSLGGNFDISKPFGVNDIMTLKKDAK